jgi:dihydroorotase
MIAKSEPVFAIEGRAFIRGEFVHRRIEIQKSYGLISRITAPRGDADLVLDDAHRILPGLIDFHVHAREDATGKDVYKESFQSAGEAAVHGGVVAFVDMPNNPKPPVDDASYNEKRELTGRSPVEVFLYAGIGPRTRPLSFPVPYKVYMGPSVGDLYFENHASLREALAHYGGHWVGFHAESPEILRQHQHQKTHAERRPPEAEAAAVRLSLQLARDFGIHPHICHLSTAEGLDAILDARKRGFPVTCEVTPHHLVFDLENLPHHIRPGFLQCNPPIRSRENRLALLDAFRRGDIDFLASDHAPHSLEEKERGISGIPHLDTFGPFLFWLRGEEVSWSTICRAAAEAPGRALSRFSSHPHGRLEEGFVGSLTILNAELPITIRRQRLRTRAAWSPFEGMTFSGSVAYTVVRGKLFKAPPA